MKNQIKFFVIAIAITSTLRAQSGNKIEFTVNDGKPLTNSAVYAGQWLRIPFELTPIGDSVVLLAEISDPNGSFDSPLVIGEFSQKVVGGNVIRGAILATIPENLSVSNHYRIRITSTTGSVVTTDYITSFLNLKHMNVWYADMDGDGLGDPTKSFVSVSDNEAGFVLNSLDMDDASSNITVETAGASR